jgi:AcrR family transcriptional regulator
VLWGRRERGRRGPKAGLTTDAVVDAAVALADADGLDAVSMSSVANRLGFTTMSLYRYVNSKDELLQLMWNASARGAQTLVLRGRSWRTRLREWTTIQREIIDQHPWITQLPMATPPLAPNSLTFVELGLAAMDDTDLPDADKLRVIGLLSSFTLSEARMAHDARRAAQRPAEQRPDEAPNDAPSEASSEAQGTPPPTFESVLRLVVDVDTYPRLHRIAWSAGGSVDAGSDEEAAAFLAGIDTILDGVQVAVERAQRARAARGRRTRS